MSNKNKKIENRSISSSESLLAALKLMDAQKVKMLFVFDKEHFVSILTIGDIQRAIVKNIALETPVAQVVDRNKKFAHTNEQMDVIREKMLRLRAECMPVLDEMVNWKMLYSGVICLKKKKQIFALRLTCLWLSWQEAKEHA